MAGSSPDELIIILRGAWEFQGKVDALKTHPLPPPHLMLAKVDHYLVQGSFKLHWCASKSGGLSMVSGSDFVALMHPTSSVSLLSSA